MMTIINELNVLEIAGFGLIIAAFLYHLLLKKPLRRLIPRYDEHCRCAEVREHVQGHKIRIPVHVMVQDTLKRLWRYLYLEELQKRFPNHNIVDVMVTHNRNPEPGEIYYWGSQNGGVEGYRGMKRRPELIKSRKVTGEVQASRL